MPEIWKYFYWRNADMMLKKWSLENFEKYINFMFNGLSIDGSSCQKPREPFASIF